MDRNVRDVFQQRQRHVGRRMRATEAVEFFNVLTSPELLETTEALLPEYRERLYPPTVALSMFMRQVLEADGSCQKAVNGWAARGRWARVVQRSYWRVLPSAPALAVGDGQYACA